MTSTLRRALLLFAFISPLPVFAAAASVQAQEPRTGAESVNFERHTSHAELMDFLYEVQSRTDRMRIRNLATTNEGREMPLVMLGAPPTATPGTAFFSGKPLVFITGNVHGGERAGREGTLQLIRELVLGSQRDLLERVNVLIVPTLNPDGAEHRSRTNTLGYDMNRDFIVAETPEITAIVEEVLTEWWPDVYVDVHNGGAYPYNLTYQATLHPSADQALVSFARGPLFEAVKSHLGTTDRTLYWYSGPRRDEETGAWSWQTTPPWARKQHTYGGLHNMVTLLFEIPGRWTLGEQAANAREGMIGLIRYVADNAATVRSTIVEARRRTLHSPAAEVIVDVEESAYPEPEQFYVMQDGQPVLVTGTNRTLFVSSRARPRPEAYAFDGNLHEIAKLLRRHAIEVERLAAPANLNVERFRLDSIAWESAPYQNHLNATPRVSAVPSSMELPEGTYIVRMSQNASRLVSELMEPDTDDSLVVWNFLDHDLPSQEALQRQNQNEPFLLPIYRIMQTGGMRTTIIQ